MSTRVIDETTLRIYFPRVPDTDFTMPLSHVGIGASKVAIKTCRKTNLAGTRAPPRNRVANTKIIFVLARLRIAPLASDWPGTFQEFIEGYGGEMLEPTRPLST